jgi:hypothetical protein
MANIILAAWWIWHDEPHWTDPDRPGLAASRVEAEPVI